MRAPFTINRRKGIIEMDDRRIIIVNVPATPCYHYYPSIFKQFLLKKDCTTRQLAFYESTGDNSDMSGTWLPVESILTQNIMLGVSNYFLKNLVSSELIKPITLGGTTVQLARFLPFVTYKKQYPLIMAISAYIGGGIWNTKAGALLRKRYTIPAFKPHPIRGRVRKVTRATDAQKFIGNANLFGRAITDAMMKSAQVIRDGFERDGFGPLLESDPKPFVERV